MCLRRNKDFTTHQDYRINWMSWLWQGENSDVQEQLSSVLSNETSPAWFPTFVTGTGKDRLFFICRGQDCLKYSLLLEISHARHDDVQQVHNWFALFREIRSACTWNYWYAHIHAILWTADIVLRRADVTAEDGSYDRFLDADGWYMESIMRSKKAKLERQKRSEQRWWFRRATTGVFGK